MEKKTSFSMDVSYAAKGIAIILMLIHHLFSCFPDFVEKYSVSTLKIGTERLMEFSAHAKVCVAIFVFVTAYGIALSFKENGCIQSAKKRFFKLEKNFWVVFLIAVATCFLRPDRLSVYLGGGLKMAPFFFLADGTGFASLLASPTYNETWWYMSLAILLIFLIPLLTWLYSRLGILIVAVTAFLPYLGVPYTAATYYLFTAVLGIWLAKSDFLTRLKTRFAQTGARVFAVLLCILAFVLCFYLRIRTGYVYWLDGFAALALCTGLFVLMDLGVFRFPVLKFLGRYSMNIFLIHTLLFEYYFPDFIYSFKNWILITLVLLVFSLAVSIGIDFLQKRVLAIKLHTEVQNETRD